MLGEERRKKRWYQLSTIREVRAHPSFSMSEHTYPACVQMDTGNMLYHSSPGIQDDPVQTTRSIWYKHRQTAIRKMSVSVQMSFYTCQHARDMTDNAAPVAGYVDDYLLDNYRSFAPPYTYPIVDADFGFVVKAMETF